jgi:hypothetical protein
VTVMSMTRPIMMRGAWMSRARRSRRVCAITIAVRPRGATSAGPDRRTLVPRTASWPVICQPAGVTVMLRAAKVMVGWASRSRNFGWRRSRSRRGLPVSMVPRLSEPEIVPGWPWSSISTVPSMIGTVP